MSERTIYDELERVRSRSEDGLLHAEAVVEFAKDRRTALHRRFCWDDSEAARRYRIEQARDLIQAAVTVLPRFDRSVRAYVSLCGDRQAEGGYRPTVDVFANRDLREAMLSEALAEFSRFRQKYETVKELAPVFEAAERLAEPQPAA